MAGYREFQTGEVRTAANVNDFLMEQSVMTFADDAARTTALAAVLREGLLTYNWDTNALERYDGTAWVPAAPDVAGIGSNVVSTTKTDTFSTSSSSFTAITGLAATITPSSATAKVLVMVHISANDAQAGAASNFRLMRGATAVSIGDASGSRNRATVSFKEDSGDSRGTSPLAFMFLDSPGVATATTYSVEIAVNAAFRINTTMADPDSDIPGARTTSSITVIEVAA